MADQVTLRSPEGQEVDMAKAAVPFFVNQGYVVLDAAGRVNQKATTASAAEKKEEN